MQKLLGFVMPVLMLGFIVLTVWYTAFRLHLHFDTNFWAMQIITAIVVIGYFAVFPIVAKFPNPFMRAVHIISGYLLMLFAYSAMLFGILHVAMLIWDIPLLSGGAFVLAAALVITLIGAVLGATFVVRETKIQIPKLKDELSVMQISDLHIGLLYGRGYLSKIVKTTNSYNPDFVFITGDLTETKAALATGVLDSLSEIKTPVFFVEGNHDVYTGIERLIKILKAQNVSTLQNEVISTNGIQIIGLQYLKADDKTFDMHPSDNKNTVKSVLAEMKLKSDVPTILISHSPAGVKYAAAAGVDLMLSGHTHRGQIFPFSLFAKLGFPFCGGLYKQGGMKVFVSGGAGGIAARMRLGSLNEINLLKLKPV